MARPAARGTALLPRLIARDVSLDRAPTDDGISPAERLASEAPSPEEQVVATDEREQLEQNLRRVVGELTPREQRIVRFRWLTDNPRTLEQLGVEFGISKERVRQIEERAKRRMRARLEEMSREPLAQSA